MERLKWLREARGLSQVKLAARADLNPATVNQIERGARNPSPGTLRKLASALDVRLVDLIEESDSGKAPRRSSPEPSFNELLEDERHTTYLRAYRDELSATAAYARAISERVPSFATSAGQAVAPETLLSMWSGTISGYMQDADLRAEIWREELEKVSGQGQSREEKELTGEVRHWLAIYKDAVEKLRARLNEEWASFRQQHPGTSLPPHPPDELASRRAIRESQESASDPRGSAAG